MPSPAASARRPSSGERSGPSSSPPSAPGGAPRRSARRTPELEVPSRDSRLPREALCGNREFVYISEPLVNRLDIPYRAVNRRTERNRDVRTDREQHRPDRLDRDLAGPEALPVADRPGGAVAGLYRGRRVGADRLGLLVLDRAVRDPGGRPRDRPGRGPR